MSSRLTVALALVVFALCASGCARVEQALTPEPEVVTIEATVAASAAQVSGDLAPGAPADVPLWPGAEVRSSKRSESAYTLVLAARGETFDDVVAGLAKGFEQEGWEVFEDEVEATAEEPGRSTVLTASGPSASGIVTVTEGEATEITISYVLSDSE